VDRLNLIVTAELLLEKGYFLRAGGVTFKLPYRVIRHLGDGNYLVDYTHEGASDA
jgi:hypothetical protein